MNRVFATAALVLGLAVASYFILPELWAPDRPAPDPESTSLIDRLPPESPPVQEPLVVTRPASESMRSSIQPAAPVPIRTPTSDVGMSRVIRPVDFHRYLVFSGIGAAALQNDARMLSIMQQQHELSDDEFNAVLDYSVKALRADRKFQTSEELKICASRARFQSVHDFGAALNELTRATEENQGRLGLDAEAALGPALFSKLNSRVLSERQTDTTQVDFPALFAARGGDLEVELRRFCDEYRRIPEDVDAP